MNGTKPLQVRSETETFLKTFRRGLAALPADLREDLVKEMRSHLEERLHRGPLSLESEFGSPEEYASRFVHEQFLGTAILRGRPWELLSALLGSIRTLGVAVFVILPLAVVELMGVALVLVGLAKPFAASNIGLFRAPDGSFGGVGWMSQTPPTHEVLGFAAMPIFIFLGLLLFWTGNRILLVIARKERARLRSSSSNPMVLGDL